ncbi:hypothetical protein GCU60_17445 [Blastococcus saxobsidens]|uniref:Alpha/beta hydrolase n=1 Tax=Blastococcus saxobsidens TaxID=138336 RepID=A0A6L9W6U1_9ACTN|nr:hypothetical protein [Blastococcus saxobsidens]NEK87529.1 hypothetical protein [Blastococcus saxobsidens]
MPVDVPELVGTRPLRVTAGDGVELDGLVVPAAAAGTALTFVVAHGVTDPGATAWVVPGFGHAESSASAPLVERIGRWASETIRG